MKCFVCLFLIKGKSKLLGRKRMRKRGRERGKRGSRGNILELFLPVYAHLSPTEVQYLVMAPLHCCMAPASLPPIPPPAAARWLFL